VEDFGSSSVVWLVTINGGWLWMLGPCIGADTVRGDGSDMGVNCVVMWLVCSEEGGIRVVWL
jgi:hypothetical protein